MALQQRLDIRQSQSLVMTPQLQQSIKLLQMSAQEMLEFVGAELERNPLLAIGEPESDSAGSTDGAPTESGQADGTQPAATNAAETPSRDADDALQKDDYENMWDGDYVADAESFGERTYAIHASDGDDDFNAGELATKETSLRDHLHEQLPLEVQDPIQRLIGTHLIDMIDDSGYLWEDISHLPKLLGCNDALIAETLARLQRFDPPGVFARSLCECLAAQLRERNRFDPAMQKLVENLDLVAKRDLKALKKLCGVDDEDIAEMMAEIKQLNPKPGNLFASDASPPVVPDVLVRKAGGGYRVELNPEVLPRVLVNQRYCATLMARPGQKEAKKYLQDCLTNANWLVKALDQRAQTMMKVAMEIVTRQHDFLDQGITMMRPMVLRDIAEAISMHESTVSRVTSNKFIATPRGVYELKYFFTSTIANTAGGDDYSSETVRFRIRQLMDAEKPEAILSDDTIADILQKEGINVARRTVAKYREAMGFGSSVQRRRQKKGG